MTRSSKQRLRKVIPYIAVTLIGLLIVFGVYIVTGDREIPGNSGQTAASGDQTEQHPGDGSDAASQEGGSASSPEAIPVDADIPTVPAADGVSVNQLVDRYYTAKISGDSAELNEIVDAETSYDEAELKNETQYIVKYDNFTSYTLPGPTENYFVVYVKYDIFFNGIETGAPALNRFVVMKSTDGEYHIVDKELSGDFQAFLKEQEETETGRKLRSQVNIELQEACDKDPDLAYLMNLLNGNQPGSTETPTETESPSSEETEPESTEEATEKKGEAAM